MILKRILNPVVRFLNNMPSLLGLSLAYHTFGHALPSQQNPYVLLHCDRVSTLDHHQKIYLEGHANIYFDGYFLFADHISYNREQKLIKAQGHVRLHDHQNNLYLMDTFEYHQDTKRFTTQPGKVFLNDDQSRLAGNMIEKVGDDLFLIDRGIYTPCQVCQNDPDQPPFWQIKAKKILNNKKDKNIEYKHAWLEFMGIPILYTPYLYHPNEKSKKCSGFLTPKLLQSSDFGYMMAVPYYYVISDQEDLTLTPIMAAKGSESLLHTQYRKRFRHGEMSVTGSYGRLRLVDKQMMKSVQEHYQPMRGHLNQYLRYEINDQWRYTQNINLLSDHTYLQKYSFLRRIEAISYANTVSTMELERFAIKDYFATKGFGFISESSTVASATIPILAPSVEYHKVIDNKVVGGDLQYQLQYINLYRKEGHRYQRMIGHLGWNRRYNRPYGDYWQLSVNTLAQYYQSEFTQRMRDNLFIQPSYPVAPLARLHPTLSLRWGIPLIDLSSPWSPEIEPIVAFHYNPIKASRMKVANEDSVYSEIHPYNMDQPWRVSGYDLLDDDTRIFVGGRFQSLAPYQSDITMILGHNFPLKRRHELKPSMIEGFNLNDTVMQIIWSRNLDISYTARFHHTMEPALQNLTFNIPTRYGHYKTAWIASNAAQMPLFENDKQYHQWALGYSSPQWHQWQLNWHHVFNLNKEPYVRQTLINPYQNFNTLRSNLEAIYKNECFMFHIGYSKSYFKNADVKPVSNIYFELEFKNLGHNHRDL